MNCLTPNELLESLTKTSTVPEARGLRRGQQQVSVYTRQLVPPCAGSKSEFSRTPRATCYMWPLWSHDESIYTTEVGSHYRSGLVFFPGELVVKYLPLQVAQRHLPFRQNHPFNSHRPGLTCTFAFPSARPQFLEATSGQEKKSP